MVVDFILNSWMSLLIFRFKENTRRPILHHGNYLLSSIFLISFHSRSSTRAIYCEARFFVNTYHQLFMAIKFWSICLWFLQARKWLCCRSFSCQDSSKDSILDSQQRQSSSSYWCQIEFHNWWKYSSAICTRHWDKHYHLSWRCNVSIHAWFRQLCCLQFQ